MPAPLVAPWSRQPDLSLDTARDLARAFRVSVTAAALRLVELTAEPCAVVWTRASRVVRVSRSATFPALVEVGEAPGPDSGVVEHAAWGRMARAERHVSAETWLAAAAPVGSGIAEQGTTLPGSDDLLVFLRLVEDGLRD